MRNVFNKLSILNFFKKRSLLEQADSERLSEFLTFGQLKRVGIFANVGDIDQLNAIVADLQAHNIQVAIFLILSKEDLEKAPDLKEKLQAGYHLLSPKHFSFLGEVSTALSKQFSRENFDALLDLDSFDYRFYHLMEIHPCKFRIGIQHLEFPLYDFCILKEEQQALWDIYQQIKKYLTNIRPSINNS